MAPVPSTGAATPPGLRCAAPGDPRSWGRREGVGGALSLFLVENLLYVPSVKFRTTVRRDFRVRLYLT